MSNDSTGIDIRFFVFFFKQKTAYEMRISDWSSDVCSSDLEAGALTDGPKLFQLYVHHDAGLNRAMLDAARDAKFDAVALTVDTIVGGNRERCLRSGFTSPPRFTARNLLSYAIKPGWRSEEHTSELQSLMRISYAVY